MIWQQVFPAAEEIIPKGDECGRGWPISQISRDKRRAWGSLWLSERPLRWSSALGEAIFPGSHDPPALNPRPLRTSFAGGRPLDDAGKSFISSVFRELSLVYSEAFLSSLEHGWASRRDCIRSRHDHQGSDSAKTAVRATCKNKLNINIIQLYRHRKRARLASRPQMKEKRRRNRKQNSQIQKYSSSRKTSDKEDKNVGKSSRSARVLPRSGLDCAPLRLMPRQGPVLSSGVESEPVKWDPAPLPPVLSRNFYKWDEEFGRQRIVIVPVNCNTNFAKWKEERLGWEEPEVDKWRCEGERREVKEDEKRRGKGCCKEVLI